MQKKKMQMVDKSVSVEGVEENNNDTKISLLPPLEAAFVSTLASELTCIMAKKLEKEKTVCKLCHNDRRLLQIRKHK